VLRSGRVLQPAIAWRWLAFAVLLRVVLSPLQHTWDSQTWWNVAAQLGSESDPFRAVSLPFDRMRELSDLVRGSGLRQNYEYWAYPPGMLLVWWPIARLWALAAGPLPEQFVAPDAFLPLPIPPLLSLGMKLPVIVADVAAALLVARLAKPAVGRWYLFNPYVLLCGVWTFDAVMLALSLGGLAAAERRRWALAGVLLGLGAAVKFVPALFVVSVVFWAVRQASAPVRSVAITAVAATLSFLLVCLLWQDGVRQVLLFHATRSGGGMSWQGVWGAVAWNLPFADLSPITLYLSAQIGTLTLGSSLLAATLVAWQRELDLVETSLVMMLGYLAGSKLVNEVYPLPAVVLAAIVVSRRPSTEMGLLVLALWATPLLFSTINVPVWGFLVAPMRAAGFVSVDAIREFHAGYVQTYRSLSIALALVGAAFQALCLWAIWQVAPVRAGREVMASREGYAA